MIGGIIQALFTMQNVVNAARRKYLILMDRGIKMLATETRPCSECLHYKSMLDGFPICKKKHMGVTPSLLVTYKVDEGSCFELKGIESNE